MVYQQETGESGTEHFQGYVEFKAKISIAGIKKLGPEWARMHLEVRRGTQDEAIAYAKKDATRTGAQVEYGVKIRNGVKRSYDAMIESLKAGDDVKEEHTGEYIRHKRAVDEYLREKNKVTVDQLQVPDLVLYPWQEDIIELIKGVPDDRKIHWRWDQVGGAGKSTFTKYLIKFHGAISISTTSKERVIRGYNGEPVVVLDICRDEGSKKQVNYSVLETLKNGYGFNTMYEPGMKLWKVPHVIVFSNMEPAKECLSLDRWDICNISSELVLYTDEDCIGCTIQDFAS